MDFEIERQAAGIIFSASDKNNLFLWSIDVRDKKTPFLRRHIKTDGKFSYTDTELGTTFTHEELTGKLHHLKLDVNDSVVRTRKARRHL